jgi:hypothetical protein
VLAEAEDLLCLFEPSPRRLLAGIEPDIKQFRQACKEAGLTVQKRFGASEALHAEKDSGERARRHELWRTSGLAVTMEGLMATAVTLDASPLNVLRYMRGSIVDARIAYPEVLHVQIKDSAGDLWRLATQDADWSPSDPAELVGRFVDDADIDEETGELRCTSSPMALCST